MQWSCSMSVGQLPCRIWASYLCISTMGLVSQANWSNAVLYNMEKQRTSSNKFPHHGLVGIVFIGIFWWVNWGTTGLRAHWAFFPLWLGYILAVDGLAVLLGRPSLVLRFRSFVWLFALSAPVWWIFEFINHRVNYWIYLPQGAFSPLAFNFWSTLSFSTVIPAVFVTANMLGGLQWFRKHHFTLPAGKTRIGRITYFAIGCGMLAFVLLVPKFGTAFLWISLFFILDPINFRLGNTSILRMTSKGDWRTVIVLFAASLICGFFWELWNYYSWPKWVYSYPYMSDLRLFEMPLEGYLGYLPFGLELFAFVALLSPVVGISYFSFTEDI